MGITQGTLMRACCGAEVIFVERCPDEPVQQPVCACGAEFAELADDQAAYPEDGRRIDDLRSPF